MKTRLILGLVLVLSVLGMHAQENANTRQARKMFDEVYEKVFGKQGASLHYKVNVANLYKTDGTIWYQGKKSKYMSKSSKSWNDGVWRFIIVTTPRKVVLAMISNLNLTTTPIISPTTLEATSSPFA